MMLEADNLTKFYGARPALEGVSFAVDKGEVIGFLGVNGAGKSTTMRILTGFVAPTFGAARVCGLDPHLPAARAKFGYLPESNPLPARFRVREYLRFRAGIKGLGRKSAGAVAEAAGRCGIAEEMETMIGQLSKGMRQRVGLADSILGDPEILILDEPTAGLDPRQAEETRELVANLGANATVFLSSHILHDVERLCRRVIILDKGRIAADGDLEGICEANVEERIIRLELLTAEPVRESLRVIPGVRAVSVEPSPADPKAVQVKLTTTAGVDLRREVSAVCAARGWLATEMRMEPVRLEDIFRRLTKG